MKRKRERTEDGAARSAKTPVKHSGGASRDEVSDGPAPQPVRNLNMAIGKMDSHLLADYVAQRNRRFGEQLSSAEIENLRLPESAILDTSDWDHERLAQMLPSFLEHFAQSGEGSANLSLAPTKPGAPHTLVVTAAALRAVDLVRVLKQFQSEDATIAKLFAKHIKLNDAIDHAKKTRMNMGVGTPSRIMDLVVGSALTLESLERVVIDCSFLDQKKRSIFDMKETLQPLMQLLSREELKARYVCSHAPVKVVFY